MRHSSLELYEGLFCFLPFGIAHSSMKIGTHTAVVVEVGSGGGVRKWENVWSKRTGFFCCWMAAAKGIGFKGWWCSEDDNDDYEPWGKLTMAWAKFIIWWWGEEFQISIFRQNCIVLGEYYYYSWVLWQVYYSHFSTHSTTVLRCY